VNFNLCIGCGCREDHACPMDRMGIASGCWWIRFEAGGGGVCSNCGDLTKAWDRGERQLQTAMIADRFWRQVLFIHGTEASARAWLAAPLQELEGRTPLQLVHEGKFEDLHTLIDMYRYGATY
jgi:antitoxin Xre/MbcA/ParS-like protein